MTKITKQLLLSNGYWVLNKEIVKAFGVETALLLSVFSEAESMLADEDGWFYQTSSTIEEISGLTNHKQTKAINDLINKGILIQENRGLPCKRYFKISYENIENLVFKNFKNCISKNLKTSIQNFSNNKESINKEHKDKESINKKNTNKNNSNSAQKQKATQDNFMDELDDVFDTYSE